MLRTPLIQIIGTNDRNMNYPFNSAHRGLLPERTGVFVTAQGSIKGDLRMRNHVRVVHLISYAQETRHSTRREHLDEDFREEERERTQGTRSSRFMVATRSIPSVCFIICLRSFSFSGQLYAGRQVCNVSGYPGHPVSRTTLAYVAEETGTRPPVRAH